METTINVEELIVEVEKRPLLWNSSDEHYKYKTLTKAAWIDICNVLISDFDQLEQQEQQIVAARVNHKWRNVRDNFTRDLKLRLDRNTCRKRRYIFADKLDFLMKEKLKKTGDHSSFDTSPRSETDNTSTGDGDNDIDVDVHYSSNSSAISASKIEKEEILEDPLMTFVDTTLHHGEHTSNSVPQTSHSSAGNLISQPSTSSVQNIDEDKLFFDSVLPTVKTLDTDTKLEFRIEVLNILRKLKKKNH